MSKVGMWNGVDSGAANAEAIERAAQRSNYTREAQRYNLLASFNGPSQSM